MGEPCKNCKLDHQEYGYWPNAQCGAVRARARARDTEQAIATKPMANIIELMANITKPMTDTYKYRDKIKRREYQRVLMADRRAAA